MLTLILNPEIEGGWAFCPFCYNWGKCLQSDYCNCTTITVLDCSACQSTAVIPKHAGTISYSVEDAAVAFPQFKVHDIKDVKRLIGVPLAYITHVLDDRMICQQLVPGYDSDEDDCPELNDKLLESLDFDKGVVVNGYEIDKDRPTYPDTLDLRCDARYIAILMRDYGRAYYSGD